jgi:uncharacterized protein with von Willebrand factor type A (vWA) domain
MIEALARFVDALRAERLAVSPAEIVDAGHALDLIDLTRRAEVKSALRATLAKDRKAREVFDRLFDTFFAAPRFPVKGEGTGRVASGGVMSRPGDGDRPKPSSAKPKRDAERRSATRRDRPHESTQRTVSKTAATERDGRRERRLRRVIVRPAKSDARDPARRDLSLRMTAEAEREIAGEVARLVRALKLRGKRRQVAARAGRPWIRRALRENLSRGGVPFVLPYRAPKRRTTRVVLLVDVSFSVARAAGLFLLLAAEFVKVGRSTRVLAFVDRPVDATAALRRWLHGRSSEREPRPTRRRGKRAGDGIVSRGVSFADLLDGIPQLNLDAPSDYGTALHALRDSHVRPHGRDTVLVVLGDARTNRFDPLAWALADLARGLKAVLWLVPEPRSRWGTADSALPSYLPSVDVLVEATDLAGLAEGVGELVKRL